MSMDANVCDSLEAVRLMQSDVTLAPIAALSVRWYAPLSTLDAGLPTGHLNRRHEPPRYVDRRQRASDRGLDWLVS